jgi:hypothetical protein
MLRESGFSIWPFDPVVNWPLVVEVFPRLLVRQLAPQLSALNGDVLRAAFLDGAKPGLTGEGKEYDQLLRLNQDAFDAAVSAWAMWHGRDGLSVQSLSEQDDDYRLEGRIWSLPEGTPTLGY